MAADRSIDYIFQLISFAKRKQALSSWACTRASTIVDSELLST